MLNKKIKVGVKWTSIGTLMVTGINLLKISILARFLSKGDFGLVAIVMFVLGFVELFNDLGLTSAVLHKKEISQREYSSLYWFNIGTSVIIFLMVIAVSPLISVIYEEPELRTAIPVIGLNIILTGFGRLHKTIDHKNLLFKRVSLIEITAGVISLALSVILVYKGFKVYSIIYSTVLQYFLMNVLYLYFGLKENGISFHFKMKEVSPFLNIGMYQVGGQVVNYFNKDLDILLIGKLLGSEVLGSYSLAKQLVWRPMQVINPIIIRVATPALSLFQNNLGELKRIYLKLINVVSTINIPLYLFIIIFSPWIVAVLYGNNYENIVLLVRILSIYMMIRAISSPVGSLVVASGRTDMEFYWNIFSLAVTPLFLFIGSKFGVIGAAMGMTLSMIFLFVPFWRILIFRLIKVNFKDYIKAIFSLDLEGLRNFRK